MVQGTMSGAGKSLLVAGLCRIFKQDGYRVAPFKSQNMALNSYVTADGLEMGRAQVMQAEAAGLAPDVRMNPILLKPSSDTGSQVIVNGEIRGQMSAVDYFKYKKQLIPDIMEAYNGLAEENDIIVIEGAGSPAEINLRDDDIVNMGMAELVDAPVLLAGDIDRGGVFAQLYGTCELVRPEEKNRIKGLIINKFRGDVEILRPGLKMLEDKVHIPVVGVIPYLYVDVDDEDSLAPRLSQTKAKENRPIDIAVIRLPRISNFTDFSPLEAHPALGVRYVGRREELKDPDMIILPGTKSTMHDLRWLRENGLEAEILKLNAAGTPVLGVCGGYQMLGRTVSDPDHAESDAGHEQMRGMGLLPMDTVFLQKKTRTRYQADIVEGPFAGVKLDGYEIHMGESRMDVGEGAKADSQTDKKADLTGTGKAGLSEEKMSSGKAYHFCMLENGHPDGCMVPEKHVFGTYLHGLFDTGELTARLAEYLAEKKGISIAELKPIPHAAYVQQQYDKLADGMRQALDMEAVYACMGL